MAHHRHRVLAIRRTVRGLSALTLALLMLTALSGAAVAQERSPADPPSEPQNCVSSRNGVLTLSAAPACRSVSLAVLRTAITAMNEADAAEPAPARRRGLNIRQFPLHGLPLDPSAGGRYYGQR